jgi:protein-tyrosine-phosphatase
MPSILFVCTANVCRSPLAQALFREKLENEGNQGEWRVESAGTWAFEGEHAAAKSITLMEERGRDLRSHRSRGVTPQMLRQFDLILTMERGHKEALRAEFPEVGERTFVLTELIDEIRDIRDPMGGFLEDFKTTIRDLEDIIERGYEKILRLVGYTTRQDRPSEQSSKDQE